MSVTLIFSYKRAHYAKGLISVLQELSASIDKIFILAVVPGAGLSFHGILTLSWYFPSFSFLVWAQGPAQRGISRGLSYLRNLEATQEIQNKSQNSLKILRKQLWKQLWKQLSKESLKILWKQLWLCLHLLQNSWMGKLIFWAIKVFYSLKILHFIF